MKFCTLSLILFLLPFITFAQVNHVPNGSFEYYSVCPPGNFQLSDCNGWYDFTNASPDYFNACAPNSTLQSVPYNFEGTQYAAHGVAYMGIIMYDKFYANYREYLARSILPLQKGGRYEVSFSVSVTDFADVGTHAPGVYFFDNAPSFYNTLFNVPVIPQVTFNSYGLIMDTNWTRVSAYYIPDSNYDNIVIGNFSDDAGTANQLIRPNGSETYNYIDSVVIKLVPRIQVLQTDTLMCAGDSISVSYAVEPGAPFTSTTVFSLELSNASGSFTSPTVIGSIAGTTTSGTMKGFIPYTITAGTGYRVRIKVSNPFDESVASNKNIRIKTVPISASSNSPICQYSSLHLTASSAGGASYLWSGPAGFSSSLQNPSITSIQPANAGTYIARAVFDGCTSAPQAVAVVVIPAPGVKAYISPNDTICQGASATFVAFSTIPNMTVAYQWYVNNTPVPSANTSVYSTATLSSGDRVYCTITASGSCTGSGAAASTDTFTMTVLPIVTLPEVAISADPGLNVNPSMLVNFTANVKHGGTKPKYQWYKNGSIQTGATYATWATTGLSSGDMIHVAIISEDPCAQNKNASDTVWMQFPAGIANESKNRINLYPNPSNGSFIISGILESNNVTVEIANTMGQVVYKKAHEPEHGNIHIDAALARGIYILKVQVEGKYELIKLSIGTDK